MKRESAVNARNNFRDVVLGNLQALDGVGVGLDTGRRGFEAALGIAEVLQTRVGVDVMGRVEGGSDRLERCVATEDALPGVLVVPEVA